MYLWVATDEVQLSAVHQQSVDKMGSTVELTDDDDDDEKHERERELIG